MTTSESDAAGRPLVLVQALLPEPLLGRGEVERRLSAGDAIDSFRGDGGG